jgi:hypothetical protein
MRGIALCTTLALAATLAQPVMAKPKPKASTTTQLQAQVRKLTQERNDLKDRLAATENLQQDLASAQKSRDLARQEAAASKKALADLRSSLAENQNSGEDILRELQKTKADLATTQTEATKLKAQLDDCQAKLRGQVDEGALVLLTREITPARALNLNRVTPKVRKVNRGVVVVNVLVNEAGEVLDSRLLQGLPGDDEWVRKAGDECVEAAKRIVFDPARAIDGKTKVKVWQGVGFLID